MKRVLWVLLIMINIIHSKGLYDISKAQNILEISRLNKKKYLNESYEIKKNEIYRLDKELSYSRISLLEKKFNYKLDKLKIDNSLKVLKERVSINGKAIEYYINLRGEMEKNLESFSQLELLEIEEKVKRFQLEVQKDELEVSRLKNELEKYYTTDIGFEEGSYILSLEEEKEILEDLLLQEKELMIIKEESALSLQLWGLYMEQKLGDLEYKLDTYKTNKKNLYVRKKEAELLCEIIELELENFERKLEKASKELELGIINQSNHFELVYEKLKLEQEASRNRLELEFIEEELKL